MMQDYQELSVIIKPDNITWDDISQVLRRAHQKNLDTGVFMPNPFLPPNEIKEKIEEKEGIMFVALMEGKLVGTGAIGFAEKKMWCFKGKIANLCFGSVLPEFSGKGIYKALAEARENYILSMGFDKVRFDTHEKNTKIINLNKKRGYILVDYIIHPDHSSVIMVKWLNGCPYSHLHCVLRFLWNKYISKIKVMIYRCLFSQK